MSKSTHETGNITRTIEILFKAPVRESRYPTEYGRYYRYLKGKDVYTGKPIDFGTVFDSLDKEGLNPSIYDWVEFSYNGEKRYKINKNYDGVFLDAGHKVGDEKIVAGEWISWNKIGHREGEASVTLQFQYLRYGHGFARDDQLGISISDEDLPFDFSPMLNEINEEIGLDGWIKITGTARVARKKVHRDGIEEWIDIPVFYDATKMDIDGYELGNLKSAIKKFKITQSYTDFVTALRKELDSGRFVSPQQALSMAAEYGIADEIDPIKELREAVFKDKYDYRCFEFLHALVDDERCIYFGSHGFVFEINGFQIWEVPIPGVATYIFDGKVNSAELCAKVEVTTRNVIRQTEMADHLGYINRVIHPKTAEEDSEEEIKYYTRWCNDVTKAVGL